MGVRKRRTRLARLLDDDRVTVVRVGSKEWHHAWRGLLAISGDEEPETLDPRSGEVWQYMDSEWSWGDWAHVFRHRSHPRFCGQRIYLRVPASKQWQRAQKARLKAKARRKARRAG